VVAVVPAAPAPVVEPPLEAYEVGPRPDRSSDGDPTPWEASFAELLRVVPPHLREEVAAAAEAGRLAAQRGEPSTITDEDIPGSEVADARQREVRQQALQACLPPNRAAAHTGLAGLDPRHQHPAALGRWLKDPQARTLVLAGGTGGGKTQAAYAVAAEAANVGAARTHPRTGKVTLRPLVVRAWTVNGYLAELRPDGSPDPVWHTRHRARTAELLILDDLGAETDAETTEFIRRELVELMEHRLERHLRTVFTTNLPSDQIVKRFGDRLFSRMCEQATALRFLGADRRNIHQLSW
jgi:hypothetical protein